MQRFCYNALEIHHGKRRLQTEWENTPLHPTYTASYSERAEDFAVSHVGCIEHAKFFSSRYVL
jgi:hypothetical protein